MTSWEEASPAERDLRYDAHLAEYEAAIAKMRPSVLYQPKLFADGDQWCVLFGDDIQTGVCGFGTTPEEAMLAFDEAWKKGILPVAERTS